jgi:hypothetical protein
MKVLNLLSVNFVLAKCKYNTTTLEEVFRHFDPFRICWASKFLKCKQYLLFFSILLNLFGFKERKMKLSCDHGWLPIHFATFLSSIVASFNSVAPY